MRTALRQPCQSVDAQAAGDEAAVDSFCMNLFKPCFRSSLSLFGAFPAIQRGYIASTNRNAIMTGEEKDGENASVAGWHHRVRRTTQTVRDRVGTIGWESNSGRLWGTLCERIRATTEEAKRQGFVEVPGPIPSTIRIRIRDPFRIPKEFAAIIMSLGFDLPEEIERFYRPKFHDSFKKSDHKRFRIRGTEIFY
jgi:hypothetical protein